jgi:hypothetical protein
VSSIHPDEKLVAAAELKVLSRSSQGAADRFVKGQDVMSSMMIHKGWGHRHDPLLKSDHRRHMWWSGTIARERYGHAGPRAFVSTHLAENFNEEECVGTIQPTQAAYGSTNNISSKRPHRSSLG